MQIKQIYSCKSSLIFNFFPKQYKLTLFTYKTAIFFNSSAKKNNDFAAFESIKHKRLKRVPIKTYVQ